MSNTDLVCTRGKPSQPSQGVVKPMEVKEKEAARVVEEPSQVPRNPRGSRKLAAKKARRRRRKALTTSTAGAAAGGRQTEHTAMQTEDGLHEVERVVDTVDLMYRAGQIDGREYQAACRYRDDVEMLFSGYRCPLDQTVVGGGGIASPTMAQVEAAARLVQAAQLLGMIDGCVVMMVAGEGLTARQAAEKMLGGHLPSEREVLDVGRRLRQALQLLAGVWFPLKDHGEITGLRRFDPKAMDTRLGEVVRGTFVHATRSNIYGNT